MIEKINRAKINRVEPDDDTISRLVRGARFSIPAELDDKVTGTILQAGKKEPKFWFRLSLSAAVVAAIAAAFFILQPYLHQNKTPEPAMQISEIKTQFELNDKNIKILWVQKRDFNLSRRQE
jgi:hypothetical protein